MTIEQLFGYMQLALEQLGVWSYLQVSVQIMFILAVSSYIIRFWRS